MMLILIKSAGDLATGVGVRLHMCGFDVVMTETQRPTTVRCSVAFSRAVYEDTAQVEGIGAKLCHNEAEIREALAQRKIAVMVDPAADIAQTLHPDAIVDAIIAKRNLGTSITDAPVVVALGPGFTAGVDCLAVVETKRGHNLGRVLYSGSAAANTGVPGNIGGYTTERILRASCDGIFLPERKIGDLVQAGERVASVDGVPVTASIGGVVRGMLPAGTPVNAGMKSGDIDPRAEVAYCETVSDKARAIAGGVLEALLHFSGGVSHGK